MKCSKCQNEMRVVPEEVAKDVSGAPVFHSIGYCDTCRTKTDLTIANAYQDTTPKGPVNQKPEKKKHSGLSTASAIMSIFVFTIPIGFFCALIDLCTDKEKKYKHGGSVFCLVCCAILAIIIYVDVNESSNKSTTPTTSTVATSNTTTNEVEEIKYLAVTADELKKTFDDNPLDASNKYKGVYVELSGKVGTVDSDGKYISVCAIDDAWDITGVHCSTKKEHISKIATLKTDEPITVRVRITDIKDVLGYYADVIEFVD